MDEFYDCLTHHKELNQHLFFFEGASDQILNYLYTKARAVIMASEIEGFGLAVIEGLIHGKQIICRDIPIFREVCSLVKGMDDSNAVFFKGFDYKEAYASNDAGDISKDESIALWQLDKKTKKALLLKILNDKRESYKYVDRAQDVIAIADAVKKVLAQRINPETKSNQTSIKVMTWKDSFNLLMQCIASYEQDTARGPDAQSKHI